jgi:hypothetical protein
VAVVAATSKPKFGKEVACGMLVTLVAAFDERGIDLRELIAGTSLSVAALRHPKQRISWHDFCAILRKAAAHLSEDDLRRLGERFVQRTPALRFHRALAVVVGASELYFAWAALAPARCSTCSAASIAGCGTSAPIV